MSKHRNTQVRVSKSSSDRNAASDHNAASGHDGAGHAASRKREAANRPIPLLSAAEAAAVSGEAAAAPPDASVANAGEETASINASVAGFFEIRDALEHLRAELIDVEALALAAGEAADHLPAGTTPSQRLRFGRIQALAAKVSQQASECLAFASEQVTRFAPAS